MYGADVISVLNKAADNNAVYKADPSKTNFEPQLADFYVNIVFTYDGKTYSLRDNIDDIKNVFLNNVTDKDDEEMYKFKSSIFKCTGVEYNGHTGLSNSAAAGRVRQMTFSVIR